MDKTNDLTTSSDAASESDNNTSSSSSNNNNNSGSKMEANVGEKRPSSGPEQNVQDAKKSKVDVTSLPTRQYLDSTVVPILLEGLAALARARPDQPIDFLIQFLQSHKQDFEK